MPDGSVGRAENRRPALLILGATALSGASGYLVTALVAATVDVVDYTLFAVFWSALFLIVGGLGGVQQELARASVPPDARAGSIGAARASRFALVVAGVVAVLLAASAPLWGAALLGSAALVGVAALIIGAVGYVLVAASCGVMYGLAAWRALAAMIALDGVLRLALVTAFLAMDAEIDLLLWAVALPFVATLAIMLPVVAPRLRGAGLDVGYRQLSANTGRTVIAATATATIIAGFPVLLRATDPSAPESVIGPVILVLTLTRAPLVIPVMAMQSYLVVRFRARPTTLRRDVVSLSAAVLLVAGVLAAVLGLLGPALFGAVFGADYALDGIVIAGLVASSGFVAALAITGPALLARSQHSAVAAGWLVAGGSLALTLLLPLPLEDRAMLALAVGPLLGLLVHAAALRAGGASLPPPSTGRADL